MSQKGDKKENSVQVAVRIRPRNEKELQADMPVSFSPSPDFRDVQELNEDGEALKHWSYDHVFGPDHNNKFIFDTMGAKLVDAALDGYNSVLFMYGQTSSGAYSYIGQEVPFLALIISFFRQNVHPIWRRKHRWRCAARHGIL